MQKILFIGGGNMARALITGLSASNYPAKLLYVVERNSDKREQLTTAYAVHTTEHISEFLPEAEIIILAVKPQGAKETCASLKAHLTHKPLMVSVMTGITSQNLGTWLGKDLAIIRAMPNTPALVQMGATGLFANAHTSATQKSQIEKIFAAIGITCWLMSEEKLHAITAFSGSGPAYYFYFMELMAELAVEMGLDPEIAQTFAIQTAYGAAELASTSKEHLAKLRAQVTSKGGTTEAAIGVLQDQHLKDLLRAMMQAAEQRSIEFSQHFK